MHLVDDGGTDYRIAVNVLSQQAPSELLYLAADDFRHPITERLPAAGAWTPLPLQPGAANIDFIRGNLFDPALMRPLPPDVEGPDNDLADRLDHYTERAIGDADALVYAFGERWGPEASTPDKIFGFRPGNGVHDIHMNQGNSARFSNDDGVWQDGALLFHFPTADGGWPSSWPSRARRGIRTTPQGMPSPRVSTTNPWRPAGAHRRRARQSHRAGTRGRDGHRPQRFSHACLRLPAGAWPTG